jgi:hypothetical protein
VESGEKGLDIVMPLFLLEELKKLRPNMATGEAQFRFDVFGGSARNFIRAGESTYTNNRVTEVMYWYFPGMKEEFCDKIFDELTKNKTPDRMEIINSMMVHRTGNNERIWASKFMQILAAQLLDSQERTLYNELERLFQTSGMGNVFESIGHLKLTKTTSQCRIIPLTPKYARKKTELSVLLKYPVMLLRTVDQISQLEDDMYGLPLFSNFPLVDVVIQPDKLLQFTVSPNSHKGSIESLPGIRKQLRADPKDHKMIFVVPVDNLSSFQYQTNLGDIPQYVTTYESAVPEINSKRKRTRYTQSAF